MDLPKNRRTRNSFLTLGLSLLIALGALTGCAPSVEDLVAMRGEKNVIDAAEHYQTVLEAFGEPRGGAWRAEAMTTLARLNDYLRDPVSADPSVEPAQVAAWQTELAEEGLPAPQQRQAGLIGVLRNEYRSPRRDEDDRTPYYKLRGWAVYTLGEIEDESLVEFYADVLLDHAGDKSEELYVASAALSALSRHTELLQGNDLLRRRVLEGMAATNSALKDLPRSSGPAQRTRPILNFLEAQLKDYRSVVMLLPETPDSDIPPKVMLEILLWDYQKLKIQSHQTPPNRQVFRDNVRRLLILAWNNNAEVRTRARVVLEEFAPLELFAALAERLADRANAEDCRQAAALLATADRAAASQPTNVTAAYAATREKAFDGLFAYRDKLAIDDREVVYARLIETDAALLADKLIDADEAVKTESSDKRLQHLRYLIKLRDPARLGADKAADARLQRSIAGFIAPQDYELRRQVVAALIDDNPLLLATAIGRELTHFGTLGSRDAEYLADAYMTCLEKIRQVGLDAEMQRRFAGEFNRSADELLAGAMARRELDIRLKTAAFLDKRDPVLLVTLLATYANADIYEHLVMLGDSFQEHLAVIPEALGGQVMAIFNKAAGGKDEEIALLAARYYLECGGSLTPQRQASLSPAVRALADLTGRVKNATAPPTADASTKEVAP